MWLVDNIVALTTLISAVTAAIISIINAVKTKAAFADNRLAMQHNTELTVTAARNGADAATQAKSAAVKIEAKTEEIRTALVKCVEVHADLAKNVQEIVSQTKENRS